jgi:preprotein translocase subunit YajC
MRNGVIALVIASVLFSLTAAFAQTTVDVTGRVVRVDPGAQIIVLDNNQAVRLTPTSTLLVNNQPVTLQAVQPGQTVVIRSGEAVAVTPAPAPTVAQSPGSTVVVTPPAAGTTLAQQTVYGRVVDVDRGEVKIKTDNDRFEVRIPREVAAQIRKGDTVRLDLSFQR